MTSKEAPPTVLSLHALWWLWGLSVVSFLQLAMGIMHIVHVSGSTTNPSKGFVIVSGQIHVPST